ncbi:peptide deformylase [Pararhizobium sp.]|uniref:peptide deformylase n=1 Tax=Pararhizobium sp. TaxID=1977563 RepID=UPI00271C59ED|nr:peptide deformylase [Pararhizobium sp.]MDO9415325.1 peptide deformylase [Pararhizobium sp.]
MAIRTLLRYPDPLLRQLTEPVTAFGPALEALAGDLLETMRAAPGIGITGPHIGVFQRITVIELSPEDGVRIYVNPEIVWSSADTVRHTEGSVSMPGVTEEVGRPARVRMRFQDVKGVWHEDEAEGLLSICLQHEIDQLDGIFWIQRLSRLKRERVIKRFGKLGD